MTSPRRDSLSVVMPVCRNMIIIMTAVLSMLWLVAAPLDAWGEEWKFVVMGDSRRPAPNCTQAADAVCYNPILLEILAKVKAENPKFIFFSGDMINAGGFGESSATNVVYWLAKWKLEVNNALGGSIKVFPVLGNHDMNERTKWTAFDSVFDISAGLPAGMNCTLGSFGDTVYYCDYQNARFVVLNNYTDNTYTSTTDLLKNEDYILGSSQKQWLDTSLDNAIPLKFIFQHAPAYGTGAGSSDPPSGPPYAMDKNSDTRNAFVQLLADKKVSLLFSGHEHQYTRRMINKSFADLVINGSGNFTDFTPFQEVKPGTCGSPFYSLYNNNNYKESILSRSSDATTYLGKSYENIYSYAVVKVNGNAGSVTVYGYIDATTTPNPIIIDYFEFPAQTWSRAYGETGVDSATSIEPTSDGGYIIAGNMTATEYDYNAVVVKLDRNGDVSWKYTYGGDGADWAVSVREVSDGYIVGGSTSSFGTGQHDMWVFKLNTTGQMQWQKAFGTSGDDFLEGIQPSGTGYVAVGSTYKPTSGYNDIVVLKLDTSGVIQSSTNTYGGLGTEYGHAIHQTMDGGFVVAGSTNSCCYGGNDVLVMKVSNDGTVIWSNAYGLSGNEWATEIRQTDDGGYIVLGYTEALSSQGDLLVMKLNSNGTVAWSKTYGGSSYESSYELGSGIRQTADGGYIVLGGTWSSGRGADDMLVLKLGRDGTIQWQKTYGGASNEYAAAIRQTADDGYIIAGGTLSFGNINAFDRKENIFVVKTDASGRVKDCSTVLDANAVATPLTVNTSDVKSLIIKTNRTISATAIDASTGSFQLSGGLVCNANFVVNAGFEAGAGGWFFYTNGTGNFSATPGSGDVAKLNIISAGSNTQLSQRDISLQSDTRYRLTFNARSNTGHDASLMIMKNTSPFTNYGLNVVVNLTSLWQTFTHYFVASGFTGSVDDARLMFWLGSYASANDQYFFDDGVLEQLPDTLPVISQEPNSQTVQTGQTATFSVVALDISPLFYQWYRNGVPISGATSNSFTTPPAALEDSGARYSCHVSNGVHFVMSRTVELIVNAPTDLITNSGFDSGKPPWSFWTNGTGDFSVINVSGNNVGRVRIATEGTNVQFYQNNLKLEENTKYRLSFKAYSNTGHDLQTILLKQGAPFTNYGLSKFINLTNTWQTFNVEFTTSGFSGNVNDGRLMFWLAPYDAAGDWFFFDDVVLEKVLLKPL